MTLIKSSTAPVFEMPPFLLSVTGLAAPSRGARETCVWRLTLGPGAPGAPHAVDREEIFVALAGRAAATVGGELVEVCAGDTLIVPAGQTFSLANPGPETFVAVTVMPVGARASMPDAPPFTPPWAE